MSIEERAKRLKERVQIKFYHWKRDPSGFVVANPDIVISVEVTGRTVSGAMRSIADHVMEHSGFDYQIAETFGGDPLFFIGQYDKRKDSFAAPQSAEDAA